MSGWRANGTTSPYWRGCDHKAIKGRCIKCRATEVPDFTQTSKPSSGLGAIPLGSPYLVTPSVGGWSNLGAGENGLPPKEWNASVKRKEAA